MPAEESVQGALKKDLLDKVFKARAVAPQPRSGLASTIQALPVTGRLAVALADARWLQAHPKSDPVLGPDHRVKLPQRSVTVTVLREDGTWCSVPHRSGGQAIDYLKACEPQSFHRIDRAWIIQPDGSFQSYGIATWNAQAQEEPAPSALIWAPTRDSGWPEEVSVLLAEFLSSQSYETILERDRVTRGLPKGGLQPDAPFPVWGIPTARDAVYTSNSWGMIGLMQTPSARFAEAGEARFNYSRIYPFKRYNIFLQPFDWLEAGFRYTDVVNRLYGPAALSGDQTYKDKSIDFRIRLLEESAYLPQIALGMVDLGGTGLFSSEFIVANKRFGNFDWSLGIGWGNMGASGNIPNPFTYIDNRFNTRQGMVAQGGTPNTGAFFRGPAALFGGLQYHTPWNKWIIKAEYDGNDYQSQPQNNNQLQRTPLNLGLVYRYHPSLDFSLAIERGDALMLGFTLHTSVARLNAPKVSDQPTPRIRPERPTEDPVWVATAVDVSAMSGWGVKRISRLGTTLRVEIEGSGGVHWNDRIERIAAVLHRDAPASIETFELVFVERGVVLSERVINREVWVRLNTQYEAGSRGISAIASRQPSGISADTDSLWERPPSRFGYALVPTWQQNIGGPDGFILFRVGVSVPLQFRITDSTAVTGAVSLNIFDNFANFKYTGPSNLPRVRTYLREYMTESRLNIPNLQITHFGQLAANQYYSVYGGYLETMYGGFGAEWLYRPWHSPLAFGVDVNHVQQRNYDQFFGFDKVGSQTGYRVWTGHATAYWDTGWKSTHVKAILGRYLAGDTGLTLDISRTFSNGVEVGAWATRTNVSAEQFGEGSFDKGMYLRIPFDVMTTTRSGDVANLVYNPLTRDGGARLNRSFTLYGATNARSSQGTSYAPFSDNNRR